MALLQMAYLLLALLALGFAFCSGLHWGFAYPAALALLLMLPVCIWMIPLNLNWSKSLYGSLFWNLVIYGFLCVAIYSVIYQKTGLTSANGEIQTNWLDAVVFSTNTWTGGSTRAVPVRELEMLAAIQGFTGLLTFPVIATFVWLYCDFRLKKRALDIEPTPGPLLRGDPVFGGFYEEGYEPPNINLNACTLCGNAEPSLNKFYELIGNVAPFPKFVVRCNKCGNMATCKRSAYSAASDWNINHPALASLAARNREE